MLSLAIILLESAASAAATAVPVTPQPIGTFSELLSLLANLDTALVQRLGEQVTDLYLAEGKKRAKLWASIAVALGKLGVPQKRIDHVVATDDARQLATLLQELWAKD